MRRIDKDEYRKQLGKRLEAMVVMYYPSKTAAAVTAGVSVEQLNKWFDGVVKVPIDAVYALTKARDIDFNSVAIGDEPAAGNEKRTGGSAPERANVMSEKPLLDGRLMEDLAKIALREHQDAGITLPPSKIAVEAGSLYNDLVGIVRNVTDRRIVEAVLPLLAENLRQRLREAAAAPGTGKREAS